MLAEALLLGVGFVLGVVVWAVLGLTVLQGAVLMTLAVVFVGTFEWLMRQGEKNDG